MHVVLHSVLLSGHQLLPRKRILNGPSITLTVLTLHSLLDRSGHDHRFKIFFLICLQVNHFSEILVRTNFLSFFSNTKAISSSIGEVRYRH